MPSASESESKFQRVEKDFISIAFSNDVAASTVTTPTTTTTPSTKIIKDSKGREFRIYNQPILSQKDAMLIFKKKLHLDKKLASPDTTPGDRALLLELYKHYLTLIDNKYKTRYDSDDPFWNLKLMRSLTGNPRCTYGGHFPKSGSYDGKFDLNNYLNDDDGIYDLEDWDVNIGMSFKPRKRMQQKQFIRVPTIMMTAEEAEANQVIPKEFIETIIKMHCPAFDGYHPDRQQELRDTIILQSLELLYACIFVSSTGTVGEKVFQIPSTSVRHAIRMDRLDDAINYRSNPSSTSPEFIRDNKEVLEYFHEPIPDKGIVGALAWNTVPVFLQDARKDSNFLKSKTCPAPEPGQFVKNNRFMALTDGKYGGYKDALPIPPRLSVSDAVINNIRQINQKEMDGVNIMDSNFKMVESTAKAFCDALKPIQGDNYDHYQYPPDEELAAGTIRVLKGFFNELSPNQVVFTQLSQIDAIKKHEPAWLDENLNLDTAVQRGRVIFARSKTTNHRVVIHSAHFIPWAEKTPLPVVFSIVEEIQFIQYMLVATGHVSMEHAKKETVSLQSFLMNTTLDKNIDFGYIEKPLAIQPINEVDGEGEDDYDNENYNFDGDDDNYIEDDSFTKNSNSSSTIKDDDPNTSIRLARSNMFGPLWFKKCHSGVQACSCHLGISEINFCYLRFQLGPDLIKTVLIAHGLLWEGKQKSDPPCEVTYKCGGTPAFPDLGIAANPCGKNDRAAYVVGGNNKEDNPLNGWYISECCHRKVQKIELKNLEHILERNGKGMDGLSQSQKERFQELKIRREKNSASTRKYEAKFVEENGSAALMEAKRLKDLKSAASIANDPSRSQQQQDRSSEHYQNQVANGQKKKSGGNRNWKCPKTMYPPKVRQDMVRAHLIAIDAIGADNISTELITKIFDKIIIQAHTDKFFETMKYLKNDKNKPFYYLEEYNRCKDLFLDPPPKKQSKQRKIKDKFLPSSEEMIAAQSRHATISTNFKIKNEKSPEKHEALTEYVINELKDTTKMKTKSGLHSMPLPFPKHKLIK